MHMTSRNRLGGVEVWGGLFLAVSFVAVLVGSGSRSGSLASHALGAPRLEGAVVGADIGQIGDVKASLLEPDVFASIHGDGWVQMRGQDVSGSRFAVRSGMTRLPDARGMFLRGVNGNRSTNQGDLDGTSRTVGSSQMDTLQSHFHYQKMYIDVGGQSRWGVSKFAGVSNNNNAGITDHGFSNKAGWKTYGVEGARVSGETRPRNVAVYYYVCID